MQESQRIAIAFTVNDSYAQHCCVAMASALENNKSEFLDIYIFTDYFPIGTDNYLNKRSGVTATATGSRS